MDVSVLNSVASVIQSLIILFTRALTTELILAARTTKILVFVGCWLSLLRQVIWP